MRYASVCDGIGAAHVAWQPLGWECAWTSEIEPFPTAVVEHHWKLKNLGDMTKLTEEQLHHEGPISLLVGGTPCQSFSVAGLRKGLEDPRGNLALRFTQLVGVLRPTWVVWENVPGVLSSAGGRDFGTFLGALAELGYGFAYRVLDAQWFGVAQRRRRVFVVGHARDWRRAAAVLFERQSLFGDSPARGAERERTSSTASECTVISGEPIWRGGDQANSEHCVGHAGTLNCDKGQQGGIVTAPIAFKANMSTPPYGHGVSETLQAENQCAVAFAQNQLGEVRTNSQVMGTVNTNQNASGRNTPMVMQAVAFSERTREHGSHLELESTDVTPAIRTGSNRQQGVMQPFAVRTAQTSANGHGVSEGVCHTIDRAQGQAVMQPVMYDGYNQIANEDISPSVRIGRDSGDCLVLPMAVRRLTPRECERLQGFPDDYTAVTYRNKPASDGPRYKALGNSMAVPVMRWIGQRIAEVDSVSGDNA